MTELTAALTSGGGSKITMDRLEQSIKTLKNLFIERQTTIEVSPKSKYLQKKQVHPSIVIYSISYILK